MAMAWPGRTAMRQGVFIGSDQRPHLDARRLDNELRRALLAEQARVDDEIVLLHVTGLALEMSLDELGTALVRPGDMVGRFLFREPHPLADIGDAIGQR